MAKYRIGNVAHYSKGRVYQPGEIIELPDGEKPGVTWLAADAPPAEPELGVPSTRFDAPAASSNPAAPAVPIEKRLGGKRAVEKDI